MMFLDKLKVVKLKEAQTAGTGDVTSEELDMTGYDGVFVCADVCSATVEIYQKDADGTRTKVATKTASHDTNVETLVFDIYRPRESYGKTLYAKIDREGNKATGPIYAILYNGRVKPVTSDSTEANQRVTTERKVSPAAIT